MRFPLHCAPGVEMQRKGSSAAGGQRSQPGDTKCLWGWTHLSRTHWSQISAWIGSATGASTSTCGHWRDQPRSFRRRSARGSATGASTNTCGHWRDRPRSIRLRNARGSATGASTSACGHWRDRPMSFRRRNARTRLFRLRAVRCSNA